MAGRFLESFSVAILNLECHSRNVKNLIKSNKCLSFSAELIHK